MLEVSRALASDMGRSALPVPSLEKIILMTEKGTPDTLAFAGVLSLGEQFQKENPDHLVASIKIIRPNWRATRRSAN